MYNSITGIIILCLSYSFIVGRCNYIKCMLIMMCLQVYAGIYTQNRLHEVYTCNLEQLKILAPYLGYKLVLLNVCYIYSYIIAVDDKKKKKNEKNASMTRWVCGRNVQVRTYTNCTEQTRSSVATLMIIIVPYLYR